MVWPQRDTMPCNGCHDMAGYKHGCNEHSLGIIWQYTNGTAIWHDMIYGVTPTGYNMAGYERGYGMIWRYGRVWSQSPTAGRARGADIRAQLYLQSQSKKSPFIPLYNGCFNDIIEPSIESSLPGLDIRTQLYLTSNIKIFPELPSFLLSNEGLMMLYCRW